MHDWMVKIKICARCLCACTKHVHDFGRINENAPHAAPYSHSIDFGIRNWKLHLLITVPILLVWWVIHYLAVVYYSRIKLVLLLLLGRTLLAFYHCAIYLGSGLCTQNFGNFVFDNTLFRFCLIRVLAIWSKYFCYCYHHCLAGAIQMIAIPLHQTQHTDDAFRVNVFRTQN